MQSVASRRPATHTMPFVEYLIKTSGRQYCPPELYSSKRDFADAFRAELRATEKAVISDSSSRLIAPDLHASSNRIALDNGATNHAPKQNSDDRWKTLQSFGRYTCTNLIGV